MTHYTQRIAMSRLLRGLPLQDLGDALPSYHPYPSAASLSRISAMAAASSACYSR